MNRIECEGGKELALPEEFSVVFHQALLPLALHDIEVEDGGAIVRVVANKDFQLGEGQKWSDVLQGHVVPAGSFVNVYVHNGTTDPKRFVATLVAEVQVQTPEAPKSAPTHVAEVVAAVPPAAHAAEPTAAPKPFGRPRITAPKVVTGTDGKPLMTNLPPIIGKPKPGEVAERAKTFAAQNGAGLGRQGRSANGGMAPVLGSTRNAAPRPGPTQSAPRLIKKSNRVVERRLPKVEHHAQSRIGAPLMASTGVSVHNVRSAPPPNSVLGVHMPPEADVEEYEETEDGAALAPLGHEDVRSILFVRGHALALQRLVEFRVPINLKFRGGIVAAVSRGLGPDGRAEHGRSMANDVEVRLTRDECTAVLEMISHGRATSVHPDAARLVLAFREAFSIADAPASQAHTG